MDAQAGVALIETAAKLASFDEAEAPKHAMHAKNIRLIGKPDVLEPTRYQAWFFLGLKSTKI